jgi:hypothetical protein
MYKYEGDMRGTRCRVVYIFFVCVCARFSFHIFGPLAPEPILF